MTKNTITEDYISRPPDDKRNKGSLVEKLPDADDDGGFFKLPALISRFTLTYEEWMADAVDDPEAYGLTAEDVEYYREKLKQLDQDKPTNI